MVSYEPLWKVMEKQNITIYILIMEYGFNPRTVNNLKHFNVYPQRYSCVYYRGRGV